MWKSFFGGYQIKWTIFLILMANTHRHPAQAEWEMEIKILFEILRQIGTFEYIGELWWADQLLEPW